MMMQARQAPPGWWRPDGKKERIEAIWGKQVPKWLYYVALHDLSRAERELMECAAESRMFTPEKPPGPADIAWDKGPLSAAHHLRILRVRCAAKLEVELGAGGLVMPLGYAGHEFKSDEFIDFTQTG